MPILTSTAAKSLMEKAATGKIIFVATDAPVNFSFVNGLRSRAQECLLEKILEMPTRQDALPNFTQLIFNRLCDKIGRLAAFNIILFRSHGQGAAPLRPDLFVTAELLGFPLSDMCKLEAEKILQRNGDSMSLCGKRR